MAERAWTEDELTVARAASSVQRPGEGAWLNAGTFTDYWQQVARAVIEAQRESRTIGPAELPEWERELLDREREVRDQVRVTRADYSVRRFGRWWRIPGHYNVAIPGVIVVGPVRRQEVPRWIQHVVRKALERDHG